MTSDPPEISKAEWSHLLPNILASPRVVEMTFHVPKVDKDREIISAEAMAAAIENFRYFPIISEFHKERPIGIAEKIWQTKDDEFKALARIREDPSVDDVWQKMTLPDGTPGKYNQVSIAGRRTVFSPECNLPQSMRTNTNPCRTDGLRLDSISVCDERARNDETTLNVVKASSDDPAAFVFTTALEITQVKDTLIKAETANSPLIHPVTDGTKRKACSKCNKGDSMEKTEEPPVKKGEEDMKEKEMDEEKEEHGQEEKKGEAGTPEKQEMEKAPADGGESDEKTLLREVLATLKQLVASDKKVHESVKADEPEEEEEKCKKGKEPVKKAEEPPAPPATPVITKAEMEQDFQKALDAALAPIHQQIADLTKKLEEYGDQPITKAVVLVQNVDHEGKPVLGNAGALAEMAQKGRAVKK